MKNPHFAKEQGNSSSRISQVAPEADHLHEKIDLNELFGRVSSQISEKYPVIKGVLVIRQESSGRLAAIATWEHGHVHDGLTISLPVDHSLFEKIIVEKKIYVENLNGDFSGNFFERKLLTSGLVGSIVLKPLCHSGRPVGLIGYCSEKINAFSEIDIQSFDEIVSVLSPHLDRKRTES